MSDTTTADQPHDWRGTPITPGALVVYGAPAGRSITMVEATVDTDTPFTRSGRVNLRVVRRSFARYKDKPVVHVGADRLTVVSGLPATSVPTDAEWAAEHEREMAANRARYATHDMAEPVRTGWGYEPSVCRRCGLSGGPAYRTACGEVGQ